ncbi:MAG: S8 family serine peptidase [Acidobacteria bacterium]|nr:S8 family serine peptidase [Acidobacteriota bacterium]
MKATTRKFATLALGLLLSTPWQTFAPVQAQSLKELRAQRLAAKPSKLAPDLEMLLADDDEEQRQALQGKTLAQARQTRRNQAIQRARAEGDEKPQRTRISGSLLPSSEVMPEENQSFIVQLDSTMPKAVWEEKLTRLGGRIRQSHTEMGLLTIEAPRTAIRQIAAEGSVAYVSPDRPVIAQGHVEITTGAMQIRSLITGKTLNGTGIGVAVIDSGTDDWHNRTYYNAPGVAHQQDFTGAGDYHDNFGHGTHVASLLGGNDARWAANYEGIAQGAKIISLRVLDGNGRGTASNVIAAIDWCVTNKTTRNIRVINLSLGTHAKDSYKTDPMCLAARRAANAGIVVVAAAGNDGKDTSGQKIYGGIHSPGIDPSVITVGASNTYGTDARGDDTIATYSSRGPTRGYTVVNNVRKYDNLIKPDLVAPGNRLIGAAAGYYGGNTLLSVYPSLLAQDDGSVDERMMYLSGTSMAAPLVAGAVALMLQVNPNLTPNLVKALLMYSSQPLKGFNMLEQGAGQLNVDGAVRLAKLVKTTMPTTVGGALLSASLPAQSSTIAGTTFLWGQGVITNFGFLSGSGLMQYWQGVYATGTILGNATTYASNAFSLVSGKTSTGISLKSGAFKINGTGVILGDAVNTTFASGTVLGDGTILGDGLVLGDGVVLADGVVLGDGTTRADMTLQPSRTVLGDNTACMKPVP